ncbi:MAG: DUF393 domain-containing protein, partial [Gemmatimonadetes bacterium]|nr:DUF393 domain-containing protein [Gemmatimonadota bacterium]
MARRIRVIVCQADRSDRPMLLYDGDCTFCCRWVARWQVQTGDRIQYVPYQDAGAVRVSIPTERLERAVHLVEPDGTVSSGAHAVFRALACGADRRWLLWSYNHIPLVAPVSERAYRFVADHRRGASRVADWVWGSDLRPRGTVLTRWLFLRLLGCIYCIAFASLGVQVIGLIGSNGILPAADYLDAARQHYGSEAYTKVPTLLWLDPSDRFLLVLCWGGAALSLLVVLGIAPALVLLTLWLFYLSLFHAGQTFLSFQWDLLLLET